MTKNDSRVWTKKCETFAWKLLKQFQSRNQRRKLNPHPSLLWNRNELKRLMQKLKKLVSNLTQRLKHMFLVRDVGTILKLVDTYLRKATSLVMRSKPSWMLFVLMQSYQKMVIRLKHWLFYALVQSKNSHRSWQEPGLKSLNVSRIDQFRVAIIYVDESLTRTTTMATGLKRKKLCCRIW